MMAGLPAGGGRRPATPAPLDARLSTVMTPLVTSRSDRPIGEVAAAMTAATSSAAVIVDASGHPVGIVTDADLRARHIATGGRPDRPAAELATLGLEVAAPGQSVAEALGLMASRRIHHLPVVDDGEPVGMVDAARLLAIVAGDPLEILAAARSATDAAELASAYRNLPAVTGELLASGSGGLAVTRLLALFTEQALSRAVSWAGAELGPAPARYALVALGSLARREQALVTDQDHAMVIEDGAAAEPWFAAFGELVTELLAEIGILRCPGGVMIANPLWRAETSTWRRRWGGFLVDPSPEHVLASNIVLDARPVAGDDDLAEPFLSALRRARTSGAFLRYLAISAQELRPPLGWFGRWRLERRGPHAGALDLKRGATTPIVQIARVHALAAGSQAVETVQRLRDAAEHGQLSRDSADILANGYELATTVRLASQVTQAEAGAAIDNWIRPAALDAWQRAGLKEVARTIRTAQDAISLSYQGAYVR